MIRFQALGVRFSLPLLAVLTPLLAQRLGLRGAMGPLFATLAAHELAHIAAARACGVDIAEIRLMPFGGSARIENPYGISPAQLALTAAAGPAMNLLMMLFFAALAQWNLLRIDLAATFVRANLVLMLFNLLPALPLDGGRILYALLSRPLGDARALRLGLWSGRALAAALLSAALYGGLRQGRWNLTLVFAAVFILASERDERDALNAARTARLTGALSDDAQPHPARLYHLDGQTSAVNALKLLRPRERAWFVVTSDGVPDGFLDGHALLKYLTDGGNPAAPLNALPRLPLPPHSAPT